MSEYCPRATIGRKRRLVENDEWPRAGIGREIGDDLRVVVLSGSIGFLFLTLPYLA